MYACVHTKQWYSANILKQIILIKNLLFLNNVNNIIIGIDHLIKYRERKQHYFFYQTSTLTLHSIQLTLDKWNVPRMKKLPFLFPGISKLSFCI